MTDRRALAALLVAACLIALSPIFAVLAARWGQLDPSVTALYRTGLAAPLLWAFVWRRKQRVRVRRKELGWLLLPGLFFALDLGCWHLSMGIIAAGISTFLSNFSALIVPLLAWWWFDERPSARFASGTALALLGTGLLVMPPDQEVLGTLPSGGANYLLGNLLGVATGISYALYQLSIKRARTTMDTVTLMAFTSTGSSLLLGGVAVATADRFVPATSLGWIPLVGMALVSQIGGQGLIAWSLGRVRASHAAVILLLQPTLATLLGSVVLGQAMSVAQWLALLPLLLGLYFATASRGGTRATQRVEP